MDLCVGCKACRRECPTGVDMAKMKIEFLSHFHARRGYSLKERLIAGLPDYAPALSRIPWVPNLRESMPAARWVGERLLGLSARRSLPRWRSDTLWQRSGALPWLSRDEAICKAAAGERVAALFVDTFNATFETENALCAARVLSKAGYSLHLLSGGRRPYCCGRTYLSCGMIDRARRRLVELLSACEPLARAGIAIVGLEPACLLTLRDEALVLGLGEPARIVADRALLFEEFITMEARAGRFALRLRNLEQPVLLHAHCHQRAFAVVDPILEVLRLIPDAKPQLIETSCCGMAGSFGYEASHYAISMQMAEASLLPAIRAMPEAIVVADGISCRQQILEGAQRRAVHAARLLADAIVD
jgi:Fe-S oxidoreductase